MVGLVGGLANDLKGENGETVLILISSIFKPVEHSHSFIETSKDAHGRTFGLEFIAAKLEISYTTQHVSRDHCSLLLGFTMFVQTHFICQEY